MRRAELDGFYKLASEYSCRSTVRLYDSTAVLRTRRPQRGMGGVEHGIIGAIARAFSRAVLGLPGCQSGPGAAGYRSSHVGCAPLATVGPKNAACRDGPGGDIETKPVFVAFIGYRRAGYLLVRTT